MIGQVLAAGILAFLVYKVFTFILDWRSKCTMVKNIPTIGKPHWLMGNLNQFSDSHERVTKERALIKRTGAKIFHIWIGPFNPFVSVSHPDTAKLLLKSSEPKPVFGPPSGYFFIKEWLGMGLLLSYGSKWERNRRLLTPAFHFDILKPYVQVYNDVADLFLNNIASRKDSESTVEIYSLVSLATLDTMLRCAFSYNDGVQTKSSHPYVNSVKKLAELNQKRIFNPLKHQDWIYHLTADGRENSRQCDFVHKFAQDIISARRKSLKEDPNQLKKRHLDFLDILITAKDQDGIGLSDQDIRAEVDTFLFEGHDTTASALSWASYYLGKHPEEQEKVYQEVLRITKGKDYFTWENINECKYLTMFVKEALRCSSPVPGIVRQLTKSFNFDGVEIPAGRRVGIQIHHINNHPDVWDQPEVFRPERFLEEASKQRDPYAYVPFSAGPRNCIGQHFALDEIKVLIARWLISSVIPRPTFLPSASSGWGRLAERGVRYKIHLVPDFDYVQQHEIVTRAKHGIKLRMEERQRVQ